jgi:hypothetical protein
MHIKQILILLIFSLAINAEIAQKRLSAQFRSAYYEKSTSTSNKKYFKLNSRFQSGPFGEISMRINQSMQAGLVFQHFFKSDLYDYYATSVNDIRYNSVRNMPVCLRFGFSNEIGSVYAGYIITFVNISESCNYDYSGDGLNESKDSIYVDFIGFETGCAFSTKIMEASILFRAFPDMYHTNLTPSITASFYTKGKQAVRAGILFESIMNREFLITPMLRFSSKKISVEAGPAINHEYLFHGKPSPVLRFGAGYAY